MASALYVLLTVVCFGALLCLATWIHINRRYADEVDDG